MSIKFLSFPITTFFTGILYGCKTVVPQGTDRRPSAIYCMPVARSFRIGRPG